MRLHLHLQCVKRLVRLTATVFFFCFFSCTEKPTTEQHISLPSQFKYLTQHGWYLSEFRDTTYEYYDTLVWGHLLQPVHAPAKVGLKLDACVFNTLYFFNTDGTITITDCNNSKQFLTKWAGVLFDVDPDDTATKSWNLSIIEDSRPIYIPFMDTIPGNNPDSHFTPITDLSDSTKLLYRAGSWTIWSGGTDTPKTNDTTSGYV